MRMLKNAIHEVAGRGLKVVDGRTALGKELARWRADLVQDLGGPEALSTQQACIVDLCVRGKMLLDSLDAWLLQQPALIDKRKRQMYPAIMQRQALADGLLRHLTALGLQRVDKCVPALQDYLKSHDSHG